MNRQRFIRARRRAHRRERGSVLVETVFGVIALTIFALGIVELGWYYRDASVLNTLARDYARDLSTGMTTSQAMTEIENNNQVSSTSQLLQNGLTSSSFTAYYSTDGGTTFPTSQTVTNDASGAKNSVSVGNMIMVTITYSHSRMTGLFGTGQVPMQSSAIMIRQ